MAIYRNVSLSFWEDIKIVDDFTPEDRYFYLYLLTNPHTNLLGCYQVSFKQMVNETGYNKDTVEKIIDRMINIHNVIKFDKKTNEVFIKNWYKYNWTKSDKLLKKVEKLIQHVKSKELTKELEIIFNKYRVSIGYAYPMDTSVSVSVSVSDTVTDYKEYNNILNNNILIELFNEYLLYRKENNLSISKVVINDLLKFLKEYSDEDKEKIIKEAIKKGWRDFYPPKERQQKENGEMKKIDDGVFKL